HLRSVEQLEERGLGLLGRLLRSGGGSGSGSEEEGEQEGGGHDEAPCGEPAHTRGKEENPPLATGGLPRVGGRPRVTPPPPGVCVTGAARQQLGHGFGGGGVPGVIGFGGWAGCTSPACCRPCMTPSRNSFSVGGPLSRRFGWAVFLSSVKNFGISICIFASNS